MFRRIGPDTKWVDAQALINDNYQTITSLLQYIQQPTDWIPVTFTNSWVNYGSGYNDCAYMRDALGFVHLRGLVKNGTDGTSIFTLPVGFRPVGQELMSGSSVDLFGRIDIYTAGSVIPSAATTAPGWVSLDGITFKAVQ